jgi:hypothetical protein
MRGRINRFGIGFADAAKCESGGVLHLNNRVVHHTNENWQRLLDNRLQHLLIGAFDNGTKSRHGCITEMPLLITQIFLHKLQHGWNDGVCDGLSPERKALICGTGNVVLIIGRVFILLGEEIKKDWDDFRGCNASKVEVFSQLGRALCVGLEHNC